MTELVPVTSEQVTDAILAGTWVIDLRDRTTYARGHVPGSVNVEWSDDFAAHVGWFVPWEDDIVLLTDDPGVLGRAARDLARIGLDGADLHVLDDRDRLSASYRVSDWAGYRTAPAGTRRVVLDVRDRAAHDAGHLPGALPLRVQDVEAHAPVLPPGEVWVHCDSGHRAGIAASILQRMGRHVVHVDDCWERVGELAIATTRATAA